jgi:signal peptidase complex subunit 1
MPDYQGQELSENLFYYIMCGVGTLAWLIGWYKNDFKVAVNGWYGGLALVLVLCIPDWPMFNKKPVEWLKEIGSTETTATNPKAKGAAGSGNGNDSNKKGKKGNKKAAKEKNISGSSATASASSTEGLGH